MNRSRRALATGPMLNGLLIVAAGAFIAACERPPIETAQTGYRGTGMLEVTNPRQELAQRAANTVPVSVPPIPDTGGDRAGDVYMNVQVPALQQLGVPQFTRLMTALTQWVAPTEGCVYCHAGADLASDDVYTKIVSRRMIQMTIDINSNRTEHVGETGVTCYTCHRGQPVPEVVWYEQEADPHARGFAALSGGQNTPAEIAGLSSLPYTAMADYLDAMPQTIRMQSEAALPGLPGASIQSTERTYALMMHMSTALGVNCTYCHNTRAFQPWEQSTVARVTAWHGIELVRHINGEYIDPLTGELPAERLGPLGDAPKANCATCHRGVAQPLYGESMVATFPSLSGD